jgi:hypothetical protein
MASEIFRERLLGNFKARSRPIRGSSKWRDRRPGMSVSHCELVRLCPCVVCLKVPAETVHHLKQTGTGERGIGVRSTDRWGVPLCPTCHEQIERVGSRGETAHFLTVWKVDPHSLARSLWASTGDLAQMTRITIAHHRRTT